MKSIREILRLKFACKLSERQIARALALSRTAVWDTVNRANTAKVSWPVPDTLGDSELIALLYGEPEKPIDPRPPVEGEYIFRELRRKGVTLSLLWEEYKAENANGYQYTQFCEIYRNWLKKTNSVMRHEHKAGHRAFSDFSGGKLNITDPKTGAVRGAPLFVCTLGASNYTFAELFESETAEAWCTGQARAFAYFGGTPEIIVPDNPRAVVSKACKYEPKLNPDFLRLAQHFDVAVVPTRVRKPRDKAKVENSVGILTRWILARLRNHTFFSLAEANVAVRKLLDELNTRPFKKMAGSRRSLFESIEKSQLKPLPVNAYEYARIVKAQVRKDYHIEIEDCAYSVPHQLIGQVVEVRVSRAAIEILFNGKRVASHARRSGATCSTLNEHMPAAHRAYQGYTVERFQSWAATIGSATADLVKEMFARKRAPELGFRASFGLMRLARLYGNDRLEIACSRAMQLKSYSFKTVKLILQNNTDTAAASEVPQPQLVLHENIRGAEYFNNHKENQNANSSDIGSSTQPELARNGECAGDPDAEPGAKQHVI